MIVSAALAVAQWLLGLIGKKVDADTDRLRIKAGVDVEDIKAKVQTNGYAKEVTLAAMGHKTFWVVWGIFAIPLACWWALAVGGTIHGLREWIPVVDALNAVLQPYADKIFDLVFYTGAGVTGAGIIGGAVRR